MTTAAADERARWLAKHVLPREAALRHWLRAKRLQGIDLDDVVQETYAVLAALPSVEDIRHPGTYAFQVAHSIVLQQLRRGRNLPVEPLAERAGPRPRRPPPGLPASPSRPTRPTSSRPRPPPSARYRWTRRCARWWSIMGG